MYRMTPIQGFNPEYPVHPCQVSAFRLCHSVGLLEGIGARRMVSSPKAYPRAGGPMGRPLSLKPRRDGDAAGCRPG